MLANVRLQTPNGMPSLPCLQDFGAFARLTVRSRPKSLLVGKRERRCIAVVLLVSTATGRGGLRSPVLNLLDVFHVLLVDICGQVRRRFRRRSRKTKCKRQITALMPLKVSAGNGPCGSLFLFNLQQAGLALRVKDHARKVFQSSQILEIVV